MKIDFGCGTRPRKNYISCDPFQTISDLHFDISSYHINIDNETIDEIYCRNVLHHIDNLKLLFREFFRVLKVNSIVKIIEPNKKYFYSNLCLDNLWYRFVIPRSEMWIARSYRDFKQEGINNGFSLMKIFEIREKEIVILKKGK